MEGSTTMTPLSEDQMFALSDDELENMQFDPVTAVEPQAESQTETETLEAPASVDGADLEDATNGAANEAAAQPAAEEPAAVEEPATEEDASADDLDDDAFAAATPKAAAPVVSEEPATPAPATVSGSSEEPAAVPAEAKPEIDYKSAYDELFAPFKANGQSVQVRTPEEARRLMQMGANYTKKMMELKPNLKMVRMLEENGLLSEEKLSFLIDLDKRNPAAISKYLADAEVDPLDIDTKAGESYTPGNYAVSDESMAFNEMLRDVGATPEGRELIKEVHTSWDAQSKEALWTDPKIMNVLAEHRANGVYKAVSDEINHRRMVGTLTSESFITAYQQVAQDLVSKGLLTPKTGPAPQPAAQNPATSVPAQTPAPATPAPIVAQRTMSQAAPANQDRVRAAQPPKATARPATTPTGNMNLLDLSDEEFEKVAETEMALARRR